MNERARRDMKLLRTSLFALLGLVAPAHADVADDLHLIVRGTIDHDKVRTSIAAELERPITEVLDRCDVPCLDVSVDRGTATLLYSPPSGSPRVRTVSLGDDASQWPTLITLLAGNLVRDEAADLLAGLPSPVAPPAPPAPPLPPAANAPTAPVDATAALAVAPPSPSPLPAIAPAARSSLGVDARFVARGSVERRPIGFGFVPVVTTDLTRVGQIHHTASLHLLAGVSGGSDVLAISGVVDVQRGRAGGLQLGGAAVVAERATGIQIGGAAAVADELHGVQLAGAAAVARRAGGVQIAGAAAVARDASGLQIAGAVTVADRANGTQIAGAVNVARDLHGVQIAPINIARRANGVQVGVINIGGDADGLSLGLINIVPGGRTDVEASVDSDAFGTVLLRHGGRRWHNVYGVGGYNVDEAAMGTRDRDDVWMYGLGFGPSWTHGETLVDLEAMCWQVSHGFRHTSDLSLLNQLRLTVAHNLGPVSIVAGGALNVYVSNDEQSPLIVERRAPGERMDTGVTVEMWPSAFVGLRL